MKFLRDKAAELLGSRFAKNSVWMIVPTLASMVSDFLFWRLAGSEILGVVSLVKRAVEFVGSFDLMLDEALTRALIQYRAPADRGKGLWVIRTCYGIDAAIGGVVFLVVWCWVAPGAALLYRDFLGSAHGVDAAEFTLLIRIYAVSMLTGTVSSSSMGVLQAFERFQRIGSLYALETAATLFPLLAWVAGWGIRGVMVGLLAQALLMHGSMLVMAWRLIREEYRGVRPEPLAGEERRRLFRFSFTVTASTLPKAMLRTLDVAILGKYATAAQVGCYQGAKGYASKLGFFAGPIGSVLFPRLTKHAAEGDWKRFRSDVWRLTGWMAAVSLPLMGLMVLVFPPLMTYVVHVDWRPVLPAMLWILGASLLTNLTCFLRPAILAIGRPGISVWTNCVMLAVLFVSATLLAERSQDLGVAQAWFLSNVVVVGMGLGLLARAARESR